MLKISLHFATPSTISAENVIGRLDIGYAKLDAHADYKAVMFTAGLGEHAPIQLYDYPRWSGSVWDLVARTICKSLNDREVLPPLEIDPKSRYAFIDDMTAVIEHHQDGMDNRRSTIATAHIKMCKRRGSYIARFETDIEGDDKESTIFTYKPKQLMSWDLLARAYAWSVNERFELPLRPKLYAPILVADDGKSLVNLGTLSEPAFSGITKWLYKRGIKTLTSEIVDGPCVTEADFVQFLRRAV